MYKRVSQEKLRAIEKKTKQIQKKRSQKKSSSEESEKPKKLTGYQIFNLAIKERKAKDKKFSLGIDQRKERWAEISAQIAKGDIKTTKKDIRGIINSL